MKPRVFVLDGYNVLRKSPSLSRSLVRAPETARQSFVQLVATLLPSGVQGLVVFDGHGEPGGAPHVRVAYSRHSSADAWIARYLDDLDHAGHVTVVSSDAEVASHAHACGAAVLSAKDFLSGGARPKYVEGDEKPDRPLQDWEIRYWKNLFGE